MLAGVKHTGPGAASFEDRHGCAWQVSFTHETLPDVDAPGLRALLVNAFRDVRNTAASLMRMPAEVRRLAWRLCCPGMPLARWADLLDDAAVERAAIALALAAGDALPPRNPNIRITEIPPPSED